MNDPKSDRLRRMSNRMINGVSRALAVVLFMVLPGLGGYYLDHRFGTEYWTVIGMILGMAFGMAGLMLIVAIMNREELTEKQLEDESSEPKPVYRNLDLDELQQKEDDF